MTEVASAKSLLLLEMKRITKSFGPVLALKEVDFAVGYQEIVGLLGDNGAGKSTLIKILCGVYPPDQGEIYFEGQRIIFKSPREARNSGIETVYQDLALIPLMSLARNFWLGREPKRQLGFLNLLNLKYMKQTVQEAVATLGVNIRSVDEPVASLSGGERQSIAIARALFFGAKLLILDEPTSSLSIKEAAKVLDCVQQAKEKGLSIIFITHNLHHIWPIADRLVILFNGRKVGDYPKSEVSPEDIEGLIISGRKLGKEAWDDRPLLN